MGKSGFTEEQIVGVLKEAEVGRKVDTLCRKHGISEYTFYLYGRPSARKSESTTPLLLMLPRVIPARPMV